MTTTSDHEPVSQDLQEIHAFLAHLTVIGRSPKTIETYRYALRGAAAGLPSGLCAYPDEIAAWIATHRTPATRATYATALRSFYSWCVRRGRISGNPMAELEPLRRPRGLPRPVSHEHLARILTEARQPVRRWSAAAAYAGARCIEISRLDRDDITPDTTRLFGKGNKERIVPTHPELWAAVRDLPPGLIAEGRTAHSITERCSKEYKRLGLPPWVTAHKLRHFFGTWCQAATGDLRVTQELMGHSSPAVTQVYTAVSDQRMRAAVLALPVLTNA